MKGGKYVLCPSSEKSIVVYRRDNIVSCIDRIVEQPGAVETIVKIVLFS